MVPVPDNPDFTAGTDFAVRMTRDLLTTNDAVSFAAY